MINYLDGALLWPDQHGGQRVERGVAMVTQSSNIAINLTMQRRGLPIAYVATLGNQAVAGLAEMVEAFLDDPRVTAIGLHIEGLAEPAALARAAARARRQGVPILALKTGRSAEGRAADAQPHRVPRRGRCGDRRLPAPHRRGPGGVAAGAAGGAEAAACRRPAARPRHRLDELLGRRGGADRRRRARHRAALPAAGPGSRRRGWRRRCRRWSRCRTPSTTTPSSGPTPRP